jgi:hypothetical protein
MTFEGRKLIIKCLIEIRQSFNDGDCRYILNDLYINDYCVWIQYVSERHIQNLAEYLENVILILLNIKKKIST